MISPNGTPFINGVQVTATQVNGVCGLTIAAYPTAGNMMQFNPSNIFTTTSTAPGGSCATPNGFVPVVVNGVTLHIATCP